MRWLSERKEGWEPLVIFLFVAFLYSRITDPVRLLGNIQNFLDVSYIEMKILFNLPFYLPLLISWILNKKKLIRIFTILYVISEMYWLFFYILGLVKTIGLFKGTGKAYELIIDVTVIWFVNVILFGIWYWILDSGGPFNREKKQENVELLFPQYGNTLPGCQNWNPNFIDYLALAFSTSTTFGPTDTMFLSRRLKILMIIQVVSSLAIFTVLAARAVTLLK